MSQPQFGPVAFESIAKGSLAKKLDERLAVVAEKLSAYVREGGIDLTKKAKAEVTVKLTLQHLEAGIFTIRGDVTDKAPSTPLPATDRLVLAEDGQLLMPLSPELTARDDPSQMTFDHSQSRKKEM